MQHSFFVEPKPYAIDKRALKRRVLIYLNVHNSQFAIRYFNRLKSIQQNIVLKIKDTARFQSPKDAFRFAAKSLNTNDNTHDSNNDYDECWVVLESLPHLHSEIQQVFEEGRKKNVHVIFCNCSFELWVLLHFRDITKIEKTTRPTLWNEMIITRNLSELDILEHISIKDNMKAAIERAKHLYKEQGGVDSWKANPATNFFELMESIFTR